MSDKSLNDITDRVRRTTISWVQVMQNEYGSEMGLKCFDAIRQTFGEDLCGAVLFGLMEGKGYGDVISLTVPINQHISKKIEAIKLVRTITGYGLKEAKDAVENAEYKTVDIALSWDYQKVENRDKLERYIRELENCGIIVN